MPKRNIWTEQEDEALKYIKQTLKLKKWSQISRIMENKYKFFGRNQKQCRQRYHNHLDSSIQTTKLSSEQEKKLYSLHDKIGNKWANIAANIKGRTDNYLKNFFHSKLRGSIRKLNRHIKQQAYQWDEVKTYPLNIVYKIVEACDENSEISRNNEPLHDFILTLKNGLIQYIGGHTDKNILEYMNEEQKFQQLKTQLNMFQKLFFTEPFRSNTKDKSFHQKALDQNTPQQSFQSHSQSLKGNLFLNFKSETIKNSQRNSSFQKTSNFKELSSKQVQFQFQQSKQCIRNTKASSDMKLSIQFSSLQNKKSSIQKNWIEGPQAQDDQDIANILKNQDLSIPLLAKPSSFEQNGLKCMEDFASEGSQCWIKGMCNLKNQDSALFQ